MIDCFLFFNETDLLEIRLNSLAPYVGKFVLCECPITHSGKPKPLYFNDNKDRFKDFNITHLIAPPIGGSSWVLEHYQREYLMNGISDVDPEEIILLSDLDEIPDLKDYRTGTEGAFKQSFYYYYLNVFSGVSFKGTIAIKRKNISTLNHIRNHRVKERTIANPGGWHFSTLGSPEQIIYKIESFAHTELDKSEFKDKIEERRRNLIDPYKDGAENWAGRKINLSIKMPSGPEWLLKNKDKFKHLFYADA